MYMVSTVSAISAINPRSCVMNSTAMPNSACRSWISFMICAWIVTSRPVVGSSAMSSLGRHASAMAIIARWFMPPLSSNGYWLTRRSGSLMPTRSSRSTVCARASLRVIPRCTRSTSPTWLPTACTGLRAVIGSWKIMLIRFPRMSRY